MIYTVTFNPAIDYVVRLDRELQVGDVNRARGEDCVLGGKGINVSGVLARLEGRGIRAVVDATRDLLVNVLPYKPFLIKPNNHELSEITGVRLTNDKEIAAAAHMMQDKGARNVLVSMAGDGALLLDEHGTVYRIGCPRGKVVNSVGAGDSMVAGFVAGYQQSGGDYEAALRLGTACGSATAFSLGLATKADIDALLTTM